jgi:thiamine kinase-like enzyme
MLVMSSQGDPKSLVKIALGDHANTMVKSEAAWLRTLSTHTATTDFVPRLLRAGRTQSGFRYVAQSIVGGKVGSSVFTPLHADFLRRLGTVDARIGFFSRSPARQLLRDQYARLEPMLTESRRALLGDALNECVHRLNDWRGPFVISHGDFAFWNIHTQGDRLFAFDWEYATAETSPLFDLFHFHLIAPASSNRTLTVRDMKHALSPARAFALLTYPEFDWSEAIVAAHGLAYLLHTVMFYGLSRGELLESHPVIRSYCKLIEDRAQWMK